MNLGDLQTTIGQRLGARDDLEDVVTTELKIAQRSVLEGNEFKPWFLLSAEQIGVVEADNPRVDFPSDFLREYEEGALWLVLDKTDKHLYRCDLEEIRDASARTKRDEPSHYTVVGETFWLWPTPDKAYDVAMFYYRQQPLVDTPSGTNKWLERAFDVCVAEVGYRVASHAVDREKQNEFANERQAAWRRLMVEHEARQHTNREYQMGGRK